MKKIVKIIMNFILCLGLFIGFGNFTTIKASEKGTEIIIKDENGKIVDAKITLNKGEITTKNNNSLSKAYAEVIIDFPENNPSINPRIIEGATKYDDIKIYVWMEYQADAKTNRVKITRYGADYYSVGYYIPTNPELVVGQSRNVPAYKKQPYPSPGNVYTFADQSWYNYSSTLPPHITTTVDVMISGMSGVSREIYFNYNLDLTAA